MGGNKVKRRWVKLIGKAVAWLAVAAIAFSVYEVIYIKVEVLNPPSTFFPDRTRFNNLEMLINSFPPGTDIETVKHAVLRNGYYYVMDASVGKDNGSVIFRDTPCGWPSSGFTVSYDKARKTSGSMIGVMGDNICVRSFEIFEKLRAELGDKEAQYHLACIYTQGDAYGKEGCESAVPDFSEALKWWRKLAEEGDEPAQLFLGEVYSKGDGVEQDYAEAYYWYSIAVNSGDKDAVWLRDNAAKNMSAEQKSAADKRVAAWGK